MILWVLWHLKAAARLAMDQARRYTATEAAELLFSLFLESNGELDIDEDLCQAIRVVMKLYLLVTITVIVIQACTCRPAKLR